MNQNKSNDKLVNTARERNLLDKVKRLHQMGADIHAGDDYELRWAAMHGHLKLVEYLVECGADIHAEDDCALRYSAKNSHQEVVNFLIKHGADYKKAGIDFEDLPTEIKIYLWNKEVNY